MSSNPQCFSQSKTNINHTIWVVEGHIHSAEQPFLNARLKCVFAVAFPSQEILCLPFAKPHKSTITMLVHQHFSTSFAAEEGIQSLQQSQTAGKLPWTLNIQNGGTKVGGGLPCSLFINKILTVVNSCNNLFHENNLCTSHFEYSTNTLCAFNTWPLVMKYTQCDTCHQKLCTSPQKSRECDKHH